MTKDATALVVAISGCSSSGKTTLARLLRDLFPNTFILHQDDFYRPESELPYRSGLLNWDCVQAIDVSAMADALSYIRQHAAFPPTLHSKEDRNSVGKCPVPASLIAALKARVDASLPPDHALRRGALRLCLLDGFLLYAPSVAALKPYLDIKFFLRASRANAKLRREARDGYATLEGFWKDPPGYVDKIVWPCYVDEHSWMFQDADVQGPYRHDVLRSEGICVLDQDAVDADIGDTLTWMVDTLLEKLQNGV
ncbi:hypothetical protein CDD82_4696 [Ophiocordyceps australis]|uniref:Phosphoribulokinase/uridine kinase domain-containing protein n=1 Tax=Ophiocordyceps australis TaxID=1399860 RepID=A0A2C5ZTR6_9HYPO|nr:hypothetical protein CDD82_4696 [Ophiocordyceps australis]